MNYNGASVGQKLRVDININHNGKDYKLDESFTVPGDK